MPRSTALPFTTSVGFSSVGHASLSTSTPVRLVLKQGVSNLDNGTTALPVTAFTSVTLSLM